MKKVAIVSLTVLAALGLLMGHGRMEMGHTEPLATIVQCPQLGGR